MTRKAIYILVMLATTTFVYSGNVSAAVNTNVFQKIAMSQCGSQGGKIITSINFGCTGRLCYHQNKSNYCNTDHSATIDLLFAAIRFLSEGVGLIIIVSLIIAGIQYSTSQGDPVRLQKATTRIRSTATALLVFIFAYAILNFIIPNGFLGQ